MTDYWKAKAHQLADLEPHIIAELHREPDTPEPTIIASPAGHEQRLRGIPVIAQGIPGTQPGTNPLRALLAKTRTRRSAA